MYKSKQPDNALAYNIDTFYKSLSIRVDKKIEKDPNLESIFIGLDNDEKRVKVYIEVVEEGFEHNQRLKTSFDLENFLGEAKKLCPHLFENI